MPEGVNPIFDRLEMTDQQSLSVCETSMKFIDNSNHTFLGLQGDLTDLAKQID